MEYVVIGKLVNTHALKGEVRIISDFDYKSRVFVPGVIFYLGVDKVKVTVSTYRKHKNFDMCVFKEFNSINDVLKFKGSKVYIDRNTLMLSNSEYLDEDLIGIDVYYENKFIGKVQNIINNNGYKLFLVSGKYIPYNNQFIDKIDIKKNSIFFKNLEGII